MFVPQSVRECQEYYPQVLELPKEHLKHLRSAANWPPTIHLVRRPRSAGGHTWNSRSARS